MQDNLFDDDLPTLPPVGAPLFELDEDESEEHDAAVLETGPPRQEEQPPAAGAGDVRARLAELAERKRKEVRDSC